ncbi:hypothetical protein FHT01_001025 [Sphingomonas japonica]|uniref:Extensin-like protein C-terminus n=1 Tax=Sphingomonas japonica TaxID=511662 RepID=A0ABX0TYT7_9SPHN|nr:hypothetical protein [Sphingomonas japonica]
MRHGPLLSVARLFAQPPPVDGASVEPRRGSGLEPTDGETEITELPTQARRCSFARSPALAAMFAAEHSSAEECPAGDHHCLRGDTAPIGEFNARHLSASQLQCDGFAFDDLYTLQRTQCLSNGNGEPRTIRLHAWAMYRAALAAIEHAVMDRGRVGGACYNTAKSIDFANEVPFSDPPDRWIARHCTDRFSVECHQGDARATPRRHGRRLHAGMASANHDHIHVHSAQIRTSHFRVKAVPRGTSLADAEARE